MSRLSHAAAALLTVVPLAMGTWGGTLGCEQDVVLPSVMTPSVCGNGVLDPGEQCDVQSEGCVGCRIAPEWTCPDNVCTPNCDDPEVVSTGFGCSRRATCNMTGYWAVRETDYTVAASTDQKSTQWYLYKIEQDASSSRYKITQALDCGIHVSSAAATVDYTPATEEYLIYRSGIDEAPHGPRQGTAAAGPDGCTVSLDRFYFVRGCTTDYLPKDFSKEPPLASLPPLPTLPSGTDPAYNTKFPPGAVSTDGVEDGGKTYPGGGFQIGGRIVQGIRHSAQRDYKGYASSSPVAVSALSFTIPGATKPGPMPSYDLQESVLSVTNCNQLVCGLLALLSTPTDNPSPTVTFSFIGSSLTSTRAASVIVGPPKTGSLATDLATCANIELVLPHDGSIHDGSTSTASDASAP